MRRYLTGEEGEKVGYVKKIMYLNGNLESGSDQLQIGSLDKINGE